MRPKTKPMTSRVWSNTQTNETLAALSSLDFEVVKTNTGYRIDYNGKLILKALRGRGDTGYLVRYDTGLFR